MRWIDAHAHLYDLPGPGLDAVIKRAVEAGVDTIINAGTSLSTSRIVVGQCALYPGALLGAVGISPFDSPNLPDSWSQTIEALALSPGIVAIGEIGLDTTNPRYPDASMQLPVFKRQLEIASRLHVPVVVHSRGAERLVVDILREHGICAALFHCFTGDSDSLDAVLEAGYCVSLSGIVTFRNAAITRLVARIPPERLFVESDTPYLAPEPHRGKPNEPAWTALTALTVAGLMHISPEQLSHTMVENACRVFGPETGRSPFIEHR